MNMDYYEKVVEKYVIRKKSLKALWAWKKGGLWMVKKAMQKLKKKYDLYVKT